MLSLTRHPPYLNRLPTHRRSFAFLSVTPLARHPSILLPSIRLILANARWPAARESCGSEAWELLQVT